MVLPWRYFRRWCICTVFLASFVGLTLFTLRVLHNTEKDPSAGKAKASFPSDSYSDYFHVHNNISFKRETSETEGMKENRLDTTVGTSQGTHSSHKRANVGLRFKEEEEEEVVNCASRVHIFYYAWYGSPMFDSKFIHWNHEYLPHWDRNIARKYKRGRHVPPKDIGANFYPKLGCYSSRDPEVIDTHMAQIKSSGAGVVVVSWYPPNSHDEQGIPVDSSIPQLLNVANNHGLKITLHIEPYKGRNIRTVLRDIKYIKDKYFHHPGFYRYNKGDIDLPFLYVYDSYHTRPEEWAELLTVGGSWSIRNTKFNAVMIGLLVDRNHMQDLQNAGFDGFYTYFASHGFTYGSSLDNWDHLSVLAKRHKMLFIPSVGPGYIDTRVRPWNDQNTKARENGNYYIRSLKFALESKPDVISVTSFNEWHEGTQIEPALPKRIPGFIYEDYSPEKPEFYLHITKKYVQKFQCPSY